MTNKIELRGKLYKEDKIEIDIKRKLIYFHVFCDGTGFSVSIEKDKLKELLK